MIALFAQVFLVDDPSTAATQRRIDHLVVDCQAEEFIKLRALSGSQVAFEFKDDSRPPNLREQRQFDCILSGLNGMPELQFGFLGNEAVSEAEKR